MNQSNDKFQGDKGTLCEKERPLWQKKSWLTCIALNVQEINSTTAKNEKNHSYYSATIVLPVCA